jgi:CTP:phosphocholine cytidylyltransferase-like protein
MKAKQKAEELVEKYYVTIYYTIHQQQKGEECTFLVVNEKAKQCALIAVDNIILANPYSNPFNTDVYSTMDYWIEVKKEIETL